MLKVKKKFCCECRDWTPHKYVGSEGDFEGLGFVRGILAVATLGTSETICRDKYWQCSRCGDIRRD